MALSKAVAHWLAGVRSGANLDHSCLSASGKSRRDRWPDFGHRQASHGERAAGERCYQVFQEAGAGVVLLAGKDRM